MSTPTVNSSNERIQVIIFHIALLFPYLNAFVCFVNFGLGVKLLLLHLLKYRMTEFPDFYYAAGWSMLKNSAQMAVMCK